MCTSDAYRVLRILENEPNKIILTKRREAKDASSDVEDISTSYHFHKVIESLKKYRSTQ